MKLLIFSIFIVLLITSTVSYNETLIFNHLYIFILTKVNAFVRFQPQDPADETVTNEAIIGPHEPKSFNQGADLKMNSPEDQLDPIRAVPY